MCRMCRYKKGNAILIWWGTLMMNLTILFPADPLHMNAFAYSRILTFQLSPESAFLLRYWELNKGERSKLKKGEM